MQKQHNTCPSCRHLLSPLTIECPVCGIHISRQPLKRPLLFQVSKGADPQQQKAPKSISTPAIGRVAPVPVVPSGESPDEAAYKAHADYTDSSGAVATEPRQTGAHNTFWRLARMELQEAVALLIINGLIVYVVHWQLKLTIYQIYADFWSYLLTMHFLVSWAYFMLPIVLTGSSIAMMRLGFGIADIQPEKRLSFSLFMLLSVTLVPLSFLCMVLTPAHTTLAELLTGQEIRERTPGLMRGR